MPSTLYGRASWDENTAEVVAIGYELWQWANRPGSSWPCSALAHAEEVTARFDSGGLVDLSGDPDNLTADELNAWSSDVLSLAGLPKDHPAYYHAVQLHKEV